MKIYSVTYGQNENITGAVMGSYRSQPCWKEEKLFGSEEAANTFAKKINDAMEVLGGHGKNWIYATVYTKELES